MSGRRWTADIIMIAAGMPLVPHRLRPFLLRRRDVTHAGPLHVRSGLRIWGDGKIIIGRDVFINNDCYLDAVAQISIGSGVHIADHVRLLTSTHELGPSTRRGGAGKSQPIRVGDGVWLGSNVCVLPGVTIAQGCVVAAGAVVNTDTRPDGLYAGVPAVRVRELEQDQTIGRPTPL